jgi:hypothetical protein
MPAPTQIDASGRYIHGGAIAQPSGGGTIDAQSRTAINAIIAVLANAGLIPPV